MQQEEAATKLKRIITATKYLVKVIKRFPTEEIDDETNTKLYELYEKLLQAIVDQVKTIE